MKQLAYIMTLASVFSACDTNNSRTKNAIIKPAIDSMQIFKSILNGNWYQSSYIDSIQKTKSPFRSQNVLALYVELVIDTSEIKGVSLEVGAPGIHEGTSFILYFKRGQTSTSLPTNIIDYDMTVDFYELSYNISGDDTSLILSVYNKELNI